MRITGRDLVRDENGYLCVYVHRGKGGKSQFQRILKEDEAFIRTYFENIAPDERVFDEKYFKNDLNFHRLRAESARAYYHDLIKKMKEDPSYRKKLEEEIKLRWMAMNLSRNGKPKPFLHEELYGTYTLRGKNRALAKKRGLALHYDKTALLAASKPGVRVLEKNSPSSGKGDVLAWGLDKISGDGYDAIAIFDADNEVDSDWFLQMDSQLRSGVQVATGHRMSLNPFANIITGWYTVYWNLMNELSNRVRGNLNLSSMLTGTGFCFKASVLPPEGWRTRTFVEDLEFAFFCNMDGCRVSYVPDAVFYDEQPVSVRSMFRQLCRWATGGLQIIRYYCWRWLKALFKRPSLRLFDCFSIITLGACGSVLLLLNVVALNWKFGLWFLFFSWASAALSTLLSRYSLRALFFPVFTFPVFTLILSFTVLYSIVLPQRTWKPIEHGNQN